jgi:hypothetical protein
MKSFEGKEFVQWYDRGGATYSDTEFIKCRFESSGISVTRDVKRRSTFRNIHLLKCEQRGSAVESAILENVFVDGFKTNGLLQCWGAVFKHVTLRGRIDRIMISPAIAAGLATPEQQRAFDLENAEYYRGVDWALDIREGEFQECELQRVPAHLVRRDPETQVVVRRDQALSGAWREVDLSKTHWKTSIEFFLNRGDADVVLVAGKRDRNFSDLLEGLKKLREAGVADPN